MKSNKRILVFGVGELQKSIINRAHIMGLYVVGIDPCADAYCKDDVDAFEVVGGQDYEGTCTVVEKYGINAIVTAATDKPLVMMARIAEKYGFPFYSVETAQWSTDKFQMKKRFELFGVPHAKGRLISSVEEAVGLVFPVIVKPRDNSGSRGVKLCRNIEELKTSIQEAFGNSKLDSVLVEEFIEGPEYSIEGLHHDGKDEVIQFTEKKTTEFPYNVELGHKQPANLAEEQKAAIRVIVSKIGKAMNFMNCPSHTELKINNRGIFVIETSPRLGGDYITSTLTPLSSGINIEDQLLHIALGEPVDTKTGRVEKASGVHFFCLPEGRVKKIDTKALDETELWPGIYSRSLKLKEGDEVHQITSSLNRYGGFIVEAENREVLDQMMTIYEKRIIGMITIKFNNKDRQLKGKRLLVLGGSIWKNAIKNYADMNGIILISAGLYPAGTDEIAEEVYRIDTTLSELMIPFIKDHHIDGVYMGGSELIISAACQWINELGLPCYCTKEQWEFLQNKRNFKELCIKYGLPVAPRFQINKADILHSIQLEGFPVITKPEDGSGSNGFSVCHTPEELERGYAKAAANSPTESVICEKYVKNDSVVVFYTFSNGGMFFSGLEDKISVKFPKQGTYVGGLFVFESNYTREFRSRFEDKLQQLFQSIGVKEGSAWIEVFHDGNEYYFNEVGFRYGGSVSVYPVDYLHQYNQVAADIYYALTGESMIEGHPTLIPLSIPRKKYYAIYPVYVRPGKIVGIGGVEKIEKNPNVVLCSLTKHIGSEIPDSGSFNQNFALVHFVYDAIEECGDMLCFIHETLKVNNERGEDMVLKMLDFDAVKMQVHDR